MAKVQGRERFGDASSRLVLPASTRVGVGCDAEMERFISAGAYKMGLYAIFQEVLDRFSSWHF
jgi:hypothetical protein